ncbi:MAG TPA: prepilin-type N-terminal cleavage/methylation domain-containing protein [Opitutaceae bacterium]|nr:prepilin-type N-terminal cleavage/methylation domain-containing protein [Opitutaceae bacterium]
MKVFRSGFTLIEVMIALAIFVLAAVVLGGAYLNVLTGYESANRASTSDQDVRFARAALLSETDPKVVVQGGDFTTENQHQVRWKAEIEPTETTDVFDVTFDCEVSGADLKKPEHVTQHFRLLRPTWAEDADRNKIRAKNTERINKLLKLIP